MQKKVIFDVVGALIRRKDKILVCQRFEDDLFGSLWEFPGGKVEKQENKISALKREIKEETGISNITRIIEDVHVFEFYDPHMREYVFGVEVPQTEKVVLDEKEHSEFK